MKSTIKEMRLNENEERILLSTEKNEIFLLNLTIQNFSFASLEPNDRIYLSYFTTDLNLIMVFIEENVEKKSFN